MSQKKPYVFYVALIGACFLLLVAIIGPYMTSYDPTCVELSEKLLPASSVHWLGTDPVSYTHLTLPTNREV